MFLKNDSCDSIIFMIYVAIGKLYVNSQVVSTMVDGWCDFFAVAGCCKQLSTLTVHDNFLEEV
jgi:hypothetical protein